MDATIKDYPVSLEAIEKAFNFIVSVPIDDGVNMVVKKIDEIRDEDEYIGFRISLDAKLDNARIPVKVDITTAEKIFLQVAKLVRISLSLHILLNFN